MDNSAALSLWPHAPPVVLGFNHEAGVDIRPMRQRINFQQCTARVIDDLANCTSPFQAGDILMPHTRR